MDENSQEDLLDARLRDEAAYIDDAGFTARVVRKLPARPVRHWLRALILLGVTLVASVIAYFLSGGWMVHRRRGGAFDHVAALHDLAWRGGGDRLGHGRGPRRGDIQVGRAT